MAAVAFDPLTFKAFLYDWIIADNVLLNKLESHWLRRMLKYLNLRVGPIIPSHQTVSTTIGKIYHKVLGEVTEQLRSSVTKINISFDLWTSNNKLSLLGPIAHFINDSGKHMTVLVAMPRQKGSHTGVNIADTVSEVLAEFGLHSTKLGNIVTDNASNNQTCLEQLGKEHGFNWRTLQG